MPPTTPHKIKKYTHFDTPQKAGMQAIYSFCKFNNLPCTLRDIAAFYNCSPSSVHKVLNGGGPRRHLDHETRGRRRPIISEEQQQQLDETQAEIDFETEGFEASSVVVTNVVQHAMQAHIQYHMCIACRVNYLSPQACRRRVEYASLMLERYPKPEDWRRVRFSDETHFDFGPEDRIYIWRKDGDRYKPQCIEHQLDPKDKVKDKDKDKDHCRLHVWAAVGYNFKSELVFYTTANENGKMTQSVYINQILEPVVQPWIEAGQDFVLEEDNDSGHGTGKDSTARRWKNSHGLDYHFNCSQSPDLSPIENAWQAPRSYTRRQPHWDESSTKELVFEGWSSVTQQSINSWIDSMPQRLQAVIDAGGKMTAY